MYWLQMFPGSLVPLTLGLYMVAAWHSSLVDDGPGHIFTIYQGPEEYLLPWCEFWESTNSVGFIKLGMLVREEVVSDSLHNDRLAGSTRVLECPIV